MESICDDGPSLWTPDALIDARSLLLAITTTDFLSALVVTNACLKYVQALTSDLQAETEDIVATVGDIKTVISTLQNVRDNIDTTHIGLALWRRCVEM